jgi:hypothetical protein
LAVIIETKMTANLIPLMLHFAAVLGAAWPIVLFTLEAHWRTPPSPAFRRAIASGAISVRYLPPATELTNSASVSRFLTRPWLWEQLVSAPRVLLFQTDSIVCAKAGQTVDDFAEFDFVGAPIDPQFGAGYNGGLSLRNPELFLNITQQWDFATSGDEFEDQWFFKMAKATGGKLPELDVAKTFAVETIYYENPLGYHQPARWQADRMDEIEEWCPEVKMLIGRRAT